MKVAVRLFARYREAAGRDHIELELPEGGTVESAWEAVASRFPVLQPYRPFTLFALGTDYVSSTHLLRAGDEVCLFPPVSGGASTDLVGIARCCGIADARNLATMAEIEAFASLMHDIASGPRFASVKIDPANLERVLSNRDGAFIVNRIRGALGFQPI